MTSSLRPLLFAVAALVACKSSSAKRDDPADKAGAPAAPRAPGCPPLSVTIDGAAITTLHGVAVTLKNGIYETEQVELYDRADLDCAAVVQANFQAPAGTTALRAYYHPQAQGLGTDAYTEMGAAGVTLVAKADRAGAPTTLCVASTTFTPNAGTLNGKKIAISGAVTGAYCGVRDLTPR